MTGDLFGVTLQILMILLWRNSSVVKHLLHSEEMSVGGGSTFCMGLTWIPQNMIFLVMYRRIGMRPILVQKTFANKTFVETFYLKMFYLWKNYKHL